MAHIFRFIGTKQNHSGTGSATWSVDPSEIEHAQKVLKIRAGHPVEVMDGEGTIGSGIVEELSRDSFLVKVGREWSVPREATARIVAIGALKPGDFDEILPALIELSVAEVHIFQQEETAKFRTADKVQERWRRIAVASVKQSKSAWLPRIYTHGSLVECLSALANTKIKVVFDADGSLAFSSLEKTALAGSFAVMIGGERGLNSKELKLCADQGFRTIKLGKLILRAKTAALAAATLMLEAT